MVDEKEKAEYLANKRLTVKEQKFVQALVSGQASGPADAVLKADYETTSKNAPKMAADILAKPKIQNALAKAIEKRYPDIAGKASNMIYDILDNPDEKSLVKLKALEMLMKIFGWEAAKKTASVRVNVSEQLALPDDGSDDA